MKTLKANFLNQINALTSFKMTLFVLPQLKMKFYAVPNQTKSLLFISLFVLVFNRKSEAQITQAFALNNVGQISYQHLELAGEKILVIDTNYVNWTLLNTDNTVFSSGTLPTIITNDYSSALEHCPGGQNKLQILATQNLFNSNSQIEFLYNSKRLDCYSNIYSYVPKLIVFETNGNIIFSKSKYSLDNIFNFNNSSLMILKQANYEEITVQGISSVQVGPSDSVIVYNLPGQLICSNCNLSNPVSNLINSNDALHKNSLNIFPNPYKDIVNIEYNIPPNSTNAYIEIFDGIGKSIKKIKLTTAEGKLLLNNSEFSNGIYYYVIYDDGKIIQDKKTIKFD